MASGPGTGRKEQTWEGGREGEKTPTGRMEEGREVGRSPGRREEAGQGRRRAGLWVGGPKRMGAGVGEKAAEAGTPVELDPDLDPGPDLEPGPELDWVEAPDPSRRRGGRTAGRGEGAGQKR